MIVPPRPLRAIVITVSDRASGGRYADESGPCAEDLIRRFLGERGFEVEVERRLVPDDRVRIERALAAAVASGADLAVTTGGTGLGPRDVTPEATRAVLDREVPGLCEAVRARYGPEAPAALLSRAVAGVAGSTLIFNLPGSVKAVRECLAVILPAVPHALEMIAGGDTHPE